MIALRPYKSLTECESAVCRFQAVHCSQEPLTPSWHRDASGAPSIALSLDLTQDLAVQGCRERDPPLSVWEQRYGAQSLLVQSVGASDLVTQECFPCAR